MKSVYYYDIESADGSGILSSVQKFEVTKLTVLAENEEYFVVNDRRFSTIQKESDKERHRIYPVLNDPSVSIFNNDSCWGNRIHYTLFSEATVTPAAIKRKIEREVNKRFGYFIRGVDLSFIEKGAKM